MCQTSRVEGGSRCSSGKGRKTIETNADSRDVEMEVALIYPKISDLRSQFGKVEIKNCRLEEKTRTFLISMKNLK